jgi:hypothetical protein
VWLSSSKSSSRASPDHQGYVHTANIMQLGQHMASQSTSASDDHGDTVIGDPADVAADNSSSAGLAADHA